MSEPERLSLLHPVVLRRPILPWWLLFANLVLFAGLTWYIQYRYDAVLKLAEGMCK